MTSYLQIVIWEVGMSRKVVSMRNAREVLRLRIGQGLSVRQVASSCGVSISTVSEYEKRFRQSGLVWPLPEQMDDAALTRPLRARPSNYKHSRAVPDTGYLITEMRKPNATLHLLWLEYRCVFR